MTTEVNGLFVCPYEPSHLLDWNKLPNHLVRCRKNHPHLVNSITICPYNQCHHVPKDELAEHLRNCKERHTFKSIALKPLTGDRLSSSLSGSGEVGQDSYHRGFVHPGGSFESRRSYEEKQRQKNQDDLDEWFVE